MVVLKNQIFINNLPLYVSLTLKPLISSPLRTDGTSAGPEGSGNQLREKSQLGPMIHLSDAVGSATALRDGDPCSGPGENFFLKLTTQDLQDGYSEKQSFKLGELVNRYILHLCEDESRCRRCNMSHVM